MEGNMVKRKRQLTVEGINRYKPKDTRREIPDAGAHGLYLLIQPSGSRSWAYRYRRHDGKSCKLTLGAAIVLGPGDKEPEAKLGGALTVIGARKLAREAANDVAQGHNPAARKMQATAADPSGNLVEAVVAQYIKGPVKHLRSGQEVERMFDHDVLPHWRGRPIQSITKRDVIELLDKVTDRGSGTMANRVRASLSALFSWCISRDIVQTSPVAGVRPSVPEVKRDRVLSDAEIRWLWKACDKVAYPFGDLHKLLLLTGARLREVAEMKRDELNLAERLWQIPRSRSKNDKPHDVPLSDAAMAVIAAMPQIKSAAGFMFTVTGTTPVSGFSRAASIIDRHMLAAAKAEGVEAIPAWRTHDLRRTCATGLQRLGIRFEVTESVLNHLSGARGGVSGIYQRHSWKDEKRAALEAWGRFIENLTAERPVTNVVTLRPGA
jgi:integrase